MPKSLPIPLPSNDPFSPLCLVVEEDLNAVKVDAMIHLLELAKLGMDAAQAYTRSIKVWAEIPLPSR